MHESAPILLDRFLRADSFESVAEILLGALLPLGEAVLRQSAAFATGRMLRGMVHLRPAGGYRALVVLEQGQTRCRLPQEATMLPSATVWRLVESRGRGVIIDVGVAEATAIGGETVAMRDIAEHDAALETAFASRVRLLDRSATHLLVLPLRLGADQVAGVVSLEANCPQAMGEKGLWSDGVDELQLIADMAAPHLVARPLRASGRTARTDDDLLPVVGPTMGSTIGLLRVFAGSDETILLSGATGTGKSRLARWCHAQSARRDRVFEVADLNTVPKDMQMGVLFGWRKGAFTSSVFDNAGWVGMAEGGTLFIDEIDKLSLEAQGGLLHLLEERRYRPLGDSSASRRADVRFLVGTNADLRQAVREGRFREDLYYRINVLPVNLPPLRDRRDEILPWAEYMLERRHRESAGTGTVHLSPDVEMVLGAFPWPGNLRQLDNVVRRAYAMAQVEAGGGGGLIEIRRSHITQALGFEGERTGAGLPEMVRQAARAYALEAERRQVRGERLPLDLAEAFPGLVLSAAVTLTGSRKAAYLLLDEKQVVESRNHQKAFERAAAKVQSALQAMGEAPDPDLQAHVKLPPHRDGDH